MNLRKVALGTVTVAILCSPGSQAADLGQSYGIGTQLCREFSQAYSTNPTVTENIYFTWAQGFITALNLANVAIIHVYRDINGDNLQAHKGYIRTYCDAHPMRPYMTAVMELYNTFSPKPEKSN